VQLLERLEESDLVVSNFMKGFELNDVIKEKIKKTQELISEMTHKENLFSIDKVSVEKYLKEQLNKLDYIELIVIIDRNGYITSATIELDDSILDCSAKSYFIEASQGRTYISKEYISVASSNYTISVSMPVFQNGEFKGVINADININEN
jgi:C4-dicarboxylate-specific signal transduction histidine kinase